MDKLKWELLDVIEDPKYWQLTDMDVVQVENELLQMAWVKYRKKVKYRKLREHYDGNTHI